MNQERKIPKIIHYCWFGNNELPEDVKKNIDTWKEHCPDFIIKEWNESNFNINSSLYVQEAYSEKKWAFVSDYVRLFAMVSEGGIYMDTDVEVIKPLDSLCYYPAFVGFETEYSISTGVMGCEKGHPLFCKMLSYYNNRHFKLKNGDLDMTTNVVTVTDFCKKHGVILNNKKQAINGLQIFPSNWFSPKDYYSGKMEITNNTHTIHHFSGTWHDDIAQKIIIVERFFRSRISGEFGIFLANTVSFPLRVWRRFNILGAKQFGSYCLKKIGF